jgi:hypothetical protein
MYLVYYRFILMNKNNLIVEKYISNHLSPSEKERNEVSKRYNELSGLLKGTNFQAGSYARYTAITPVHDLDVIWALENLNPNLGQNIRKSVSEKIDPKELDISDLLNDLALKLNDEYTKLGETVKVIPQTHSVTIEYPDNSHTFTIDVVPAVSVSEKNEFGDNLFVVPEIIKYTHAKRINKYQAHEKIKWIKSDPKGYLEESRRLNEVSTCYRKATKFLKAWKHKLKEKDPTVKLKSFHIEQIIIKELMEVRNIANIDTIDTILLFLEKLPKYISVPQIYDRANTTKYVDDYLSELEETQKNRLLDYGNRCNQEMKIIAKEDSITKVQEMLDELCLIGKHQRTPVYPIVKSYEPAKQWNNDCKF